MIITSELWDKTSSINGKEAVFLTEHFKKQNGNDDRVLISYDGVISRIEYVDDSFLDSLSRAYVNTLIDKGFSKEQAIAEAWLKKLRDEEEAERDVKTRVETLEDENEMLKGCIMEIAKEVYGGNE